jgi:hypothetical protein
MSLEKITNDVSKTRRGFIKDIAYGIGAVIGLNALYGCGGGGGSSSSDSNTSGNGSTPNEPVITARENFDNLPEWNVYEPGAEPADSNQYPTFHDEFKSAYESNKNGIRDIFNSDEQAVIEKLMDGSNTNDELYAISVTGSNRAHVGVNFNTENIYFAQKQLSTGDAEILKSISPEYS